MPLSAQHPQTPAKNDSVRAVMRALDILSAFTKTDQGLSASDLLKRVDLSRPTLYRLLGTLREKNFIVSVGEPQKFHLGPAVSRLAMASPPIPDLQSLARPALQRLQDLTGETVALFVPMGTMRQCVDEIASPQPLSFKRGIGYLERVIYGATGRIILAHLLEPFFKTEPLDTKALMAELQNYTEGSSTPPQDYLDEILRIRRRGYAVSRNELIQGAVSVGAPIFDEHHQIAGSLGIFGPSVRMQAEQVKRCGTLLVDAASEISRAMREAPAKS